MSTLYYGGSFNPIHFAHLKCARAVAEAKGFERVVLIPSGQPPHKNGDFGLASADDRLAMCRLAIADDPLFAVDDLEIHRPGKSYTIDTARELHRRGIEPVNWLIGADMLISLPSWHQAAALLTEVNFIVMARPGYQFDWNMLPPEFRSLRDHLVEAPLMDISSTEIRDRLAAGKAIDDLVPAAVEQYIRQTGLYGAKPLK